MNELIDTEMRITSDAVLGGRVRLSQPSRGHRAGHDAVLLAAACPAIAGERVLDLGAGVGTAAFCLAARVPVGYLTLVEIDPDLAMLAEDNAVANGLDNRTRVIVADARARGHLRERAGLMLGQIDRVITNPPFHDEVRHRPSPNAQKNRAHRAEEGLLPAFLRTAAAVLKPGGTVTLIHRADRPEAILAAMAGRFGGVTIRPVHSRAHAAANRLLITGTKGSRAPVSILPGLTLATADGQATPEAEAVLRGGQGF